MRWYSLALQTIKYYLSNADPFIPNVTVSDCDPNYVGGFTLVKNDTVNTSKIDSFTIVDITDPSSPEQVSSKVDLISAVCLKCDSYVFALICKILRCTIACNIKRCYIYGTNIHHGNDSACTRTRISCSVWVCRVRIVIDIADSS